MAALKLLTMCERVFDDKKKSPLGSRGKNKSRTESAAVVSTLFFSFFLSPLPLPQKLQVRRRDAANYSARRVP